MVPPGDKAEEYSAPDDLFPVVADNWSFILRPRSRLESVTSVITFVGSHLFACSDLPCVGASSYMAV